MVFKKNPYFSKFKKNYKKKPYYRKPKMELNNLDSTQRFGPTGAKTTYADPALVPTGLSTMHLLNGIPQGTTANERIGRKTILKYSELRFDIQLPQLTTPIEMNARVMIVLDKQINAVAPQITDILEVDDYNSPYKMVNRNRFKIFSDRLINLSPGGPVTFSYKQHINLRNVETTYVDAGFLDEDISTNGLFLVLICSNKGSSGADNSTFKFYNRLVFTC